MAKRTSGGVPVEDGDQPPAGIHHPVAGDSNARAVRHPAKTGEGVAVQQLPQRDAQQQPQQEPPAAEQAAEENAPAPAPPKPKAAARKRKVGKHKS